MDYKYELSSDGSAEGSVRDLLRYDSQAIPQDVPIGAPDEVLIDVPDEVPEDVSQGVPDEAPIGTPDEVLENVPEDDLQAANPSNMRIPVPGFSRVSYTVSYCVVADCNVRNGLHRINVAIRSDILRKQSIYIPAGSRVCNKHLKSNVVWRDFADYIRSRHETFNSVKVMLRLLQKPID